MSARRAWVRALPSRLHWVEIISAFAALLVAAWNLLRIDTGMIGFVAFWLVPALLAMTVQVLPRVPLFFRAWSVTYLILLAAGALVASHAQWLPHFQAIHPGATEFADRWNRLGLDSRRMFSWNMSIGGASIFYLAGWIVIRNLSDHLRQGRADISAATCILGLLTVWFIPGAVLTYLAVGVFMPD